MATKSNKPKVYHNNLTNKSRYNVGLRQYESFAEQVTDKNPPPKVFDSLIDNIKPGARFFFFTSLLDYKGPWKTRVPHVLNINNILNNIDSQENLNYEGKMLSILQLIRGFKKFEANNEYNYFKEQLEPLRDTHPELYKLFDDTFQGNQIDYPKFMALVLSLNQDIKMIQSEISDLAAHTRKWDQAYRNAFQHIKKLHLDKYDQYGNDELFNQAYRKEIDETARQEIDFATSKIEQRLASGLSDLKKVMSDATVNTDFMEKLQRLGNQMLLNNQTKLSEQEIRDKLGGSLLQKQHILVFYRELKRLAAAYDTTVEKFYTGLHEAWEYLQMFPEGHASVKKNNGNPTYLSSSNQKLINDLTQLLVTLVEQDTTALSQYDELLKKANKKNKLTPRKDKYGGESTTQWAGLVKRRRELIIQAIKQLPSTEKREDAISNLMALEIDNAKIHLEDQAEERFDIRNQKHFTAYIDLIKKALNMHTDTSLETVMERLETVLKSSEAYDRQELITITSEHGGALDLSKALKNTVTTVLKNNFREDSVHIGYINYSYDNTQAFNNINSDLSQINTALKKTSKLMNEFRSKDIYKILSKDNTKHGRQSREYNVQSTLEASKAIDLKTAQQLQQELQLNKLEDVIPLLKNLFVLEESDKFSTTFNSIENGFKGGSLGGDLIKQVDNINNMLLLGGITPIDANFLISAIMNAGPGMLGYGQKDKIETYLSSIASVCMFTSGAQSIEEYANNVLQNVQQSISTTKIHVFKLGTLTVPLSYILGLMEQGLTECFTLLDSTFQLGGYAGNQVTINNPVNEVNDKISTAYYSSNKIFYIGDWQATAEAGLPKVNLDMAILGSYLDVLDQVNNILQGII